MRHLRRKVVLVATAIVLAVMHAPSQTSLAQKSAAEPETATFQSGTITLHGLLYKPEGTGQFPAVLYNHGSAAGMLSNEAFEAIRCASLNTAVATRELEENRPGAGVACQAGRSMLRPSTIEAAGLPSALVHIAERARRQ